MLNIGTLLPVNSYKCNYKSILYVMLRSCFDRNVQMGIAVICWCVIKTLLCEVSLLLAKAELGTGSDIFDLNY